MPPIPSSATSSRAAPSVVDLLVESDDVIFMQRAIDDAVNEVAYACMRDKGYTHPVELEGHNPPAFPARFDEDLAAREAFGIVATSRPEPDERYLNAWAEPKRPPRQFPLLYGTGAQVGDGGCLAEGRTQIFGNLTSYAMVELGVPLIRVRIGERVEPAPEVTGTFKAWAECMQEARVPVGAPNDVMGYVRGIPGLSSKEAQRIARVNASCANKSGLAGAERSVARRIATRELSTTELSYGGLAAQELANAFERASTACHSMGRPCNS